MAKQLQVSICWSAMCMRLDLAAFNEPTPIAKRVFVLVISSSSSSHTPTAYHVTHIPAYSAMAFAHVEHLAAVSRHVLQSTHDAIHSYPFGIPMSAADAVYVTTQRPAKTIYIYIYIYAWFFASFER